MRVKLTTSRVADRLRVNVPGDIIDVPDEEARRLLRSGAAEPVTDESRIETTSVAPLRNAMRQSGKPRTRKTKEKSHASHAE